MYLIKIEGFHLLGKKVKLSKFVLSNQNQPMRQTILIALGNMKMSRSICAVLLMHPKYKVVHICDSCAEAEEFILKNNPSIAFLGQSLNDQCGVKLVKRLKELECTTKLALLYSQGSKSILHTVMEYGVLGYFSLKNVSKQVIACLDTISTNRYYIDTKLLLK